MEGRCGSLIATLEAGPFALAEGPVWDERTQSLLWVDILAGAIFRHRTEVGSTERIEVGENVGCIALTLDEEVVIAALRNGWYRVHLESGVKELIAAPQHAHRQCRFNDGAVDPGGRFWTGSLEDDEKAAVGRLYRLDPNLQFQEMDAGFICSNGIDWSPDAQWMYFVDSRQDAIYRYSFDALTGEIGIREAFIDTRSLRGIPDGIGVDVEGTIWCAFWDGGAVRAFDPCGELMLSIDLPVLRPTSIAFGGRDLKTMYVTSASTGLSAEQRAQRPSSGAVFALGADTAGRPANVFQSTSALSRQ